MKEVVLNVEETVQAHYDITIKVSNADAKAYNEGELSDDELLEKYEDKIDKAMLEKEDKDFEALERWIEVSDVEE